LLRVTVAFLFDWFERACARCLTVIIAENYYSRRFPRATPVLNYPFRTQSLTPRSFVGAGHLIYTGSVTADRGAFQHVKLLHRMPNTELHMIGRCAPELHAELRDAAGDASKRLFLSDPGKYVPHSEIVNAYKESIWVCGLAIFPDTPHYREKELTKIFEYMAH